MRPIYQKERLAEEVAQYQMQIDQQRAELRQTRDEFDSLEQQIAAEEAKSREAANQLANTRNELEELLAEKQRIESQLEFMSYRLHLPDGTPADSPEDVRVALRDQYRTGLRNTRTITWFDGDPESASFPFTEEELRMWNTHGTDYPKAAALEVLSNHMPSRSALSTYDEYVTQSDFQRWNAEIREVLVNVPSSWTPPHELDALAREYSRKRKEIEDEYDSSVSAIEDELSALEPAPTRDIQTARQNRLNAPLHQARAQVVSERTVLRLEYDGYAIDLRNSLHNAISTLLTEAVEQSE